MDKILVRGGKKLKGETTVSGAKNAALPAMFASLLTQEENTYSNVPDLMDVRTTKILLAKMGAKIGEGTPLSIHFPIIEVPLVPYDLVSTMRASILALGPLLARSGTAKVSLPGGCAIGARPVNLHIEALAKMGADISLQDGYIVAQAKRLKGANVHFEPVTVTGTENIMMAATLAEGVTLLENAAREPEIIFLAETLKAMGAQISGAGSDRIVIEGVERLGGTHITIIPDRIEAGTLMTAAAITGGEVLVKRCQPEYLTSFSKALQEAGCDIEANNDSILVRAPQTIEAVNIITAPYPGFATDLQAQFMALMCLAQGNAEIIETVFENRFMHVGELIRLGARITVQGHKAMVEGVDHLSGAPVMATDLRASASLVLAALCAKGTTEIARVYHLDRGYEALEKKIAALGADIERVKA